MRKPKENTSSRAPASDLLYWLRDESDGEEPFVFMAYEPSPREEQVAVELQTHEANLPQAREAKEEAVAEASQDAGRHLV